MNPDDAARIDEVASLWVARRYCGAWTELDQEEFERWLDASTRHRVAYLRFERGWEKAARLKAFAAGDWTQQPPPPGRLNLSPFFNDSVSVALVQQSRQPVRMLAIAASIVFVVCIGWFVWSGRQTNGSVYSTPIGGLASVPMTDGSHIMLNTNTAVRVVLTEARREVELDHGEAFFNVARDPSRPFVVNAGHQRIIVLGTQFSVRHDADGVRVIVTDGQVKVESTGTFTPPTGAIGPGTVVEAKGKTLLLQKQQLIDVQDELAWRSGFLVFRDVTLADAVNEFNRYSVKKIVINDPDVAALLIAGSFPATNVEAFLRLLEKGYPLRVDRVGETLELKGQIK